MNQKSQTLFGFLIVFVIILQSIFVIMNKDSFFNENNYQSINNQIEMNND